MIKPFNNGGLASLVDYVTHKVLISDTKLRSFIPPQVQKITPKLRKFCWCELCIIPKDVYIDSNIFRTRRVPYLQQKYVKSHTRNSLFSTTSSTHYKEKVFPDGDFLHATIKDSDKCTTCLHIKPNNMIHIKCVLGFCDEFPEYNIFPMKN